MARTQAARQTRDSVSDVWGPRQPYFGEGRWPERVDERTLEAPQDWVASCCPLCAMGCGLEIGVRDGRIVGVRGRGDDGVNRGRLGPKGLHGWIAGNASDRLRRPLIRRHGKFREAGWDEAMELIVSRTRELARYFTAGSVAFYSSGQLTLEENYTLSLIAKAGLGTPHLDAGTRLGAATAAAALRESFGSSAQPGCYGDLDAADCLLLAGHDMAQSHTVLWSRVLDRRRGPRPPKLIVIDPLVSPTAREADLHLAPRAGTNLALLNGLLAEVIRQGGVDRAFVEARTKGFEELERLALSYPAERVERLTGVPAASVEKAARLLVESKALCSTVSQGVYESSQATACAVQVNNLQLIRGMIGRPGCGVLQLGAQAGAGGALETGAGGGLPGLLNWRNPRHVERLARAWNVQASRLPLWAPSTDVLEILRLIELGSIRMLWIAGSNPVVSLPELHRVREILASPSLFLVVSEAFMTETARQADVVLPAALWGEKTGLCVNADRTAHLCRKAAEPPGQARPDLDIWLDFARRLELRDQDGAPLVKWKDAAGAFEAWKSLSEGSLCDYAAISYERLKGGGRAWGNERLYADGLFPTRTEVCESYGHDLETGAEVAREDYEAADPRGRAWLKPAPFLEPPEAVDGSYPYWLLTGGTTFHAGARARTGRSPELQAAAPEPFIQLSEDDARALGVAEGDAVEVSSRRGTVRAPARVGGILKGHVFVPGHYGYWDKNHSFMRAANELTLWEVDPVSRQPLLRCGAVQAHRVGHASFKEKLGDVAGKSLERGKELAERMSLSARWRKTHVADYLALALEADEQLAESCEKVAAQHLMDNEVRGGLRAVARLSRESALRLKPFAARYGEASAAQLKHLRPAAFPVARAGAFGLLRDLHDLQLMAAECLLTLLVLSKAGGALRDGEFVAACADAEALARRQQEWLAGALCARAAQTLTVPS